MKFAWNYTFYLLILPATCYTKTLQPWKAKQTVCRTMNSVGMEAKKIRRLSNLMSKIKKCMHLLCQSVATSSLQHSYNARKRLGFWKADGQKLSIFNTVLFLQAPVVACYACFAWKLFALRLFRKCLHPAKAYSWHTLYLLPKSANQRKASLSLNKMFLFYHVSSISQQYCCLLKT